MLETIFGVCLILAPVCLLLAKMLGKVVEKQNKQVCEKFGATDVFEIGKYRGGGLVDETDVPTTLFSASCAVTEFDFAILSGKVKLGTIPRDSVLQVDVEDRSTVEKRVTATRLLTIGVFALAAQKKKKDTRFYLTVTWEDDRGVVQRPMFEWSGMSANRLAADKAAQRLRSHLKARRERIGEADRKCPFCAEIIKAEAKVCRYCRSDILQQA